MRIRGRQWERLRRLVLDAAGWRCEECGARGPLAVHHVVPLAAGGANETGNLRALCGACHNRAHHARRPRRMGRDPARLAWRIYLARAAAARAEDGAAGGE